MRLSIQTFRNKRHKRRKNGHKKLRKYQNLNLHNLSLKSSKTTNVTVKRSLIKIIEMVYLKIVSNRDLEAIWGSFRRRNSRDR